MNSFILYSLISLSYAQVINRADWPEPFKVPPVNQTWVDRVLSAATIPNSPPRQSGLPHISSDSDIKGCNDQNTWAFSYDDGPGPFTVINALEPLKRRNVKATFYVTGQQVADYPEVLKQIYDEGHSIGIHSWSHKALSTLTTAEIISEIVWTARIIYQVIGEIPSHIRPPFQDIDDRSRAVIEAMGLKIVMWNFDTNDWQYETYTPDSGKPDPKVAIRQAVQDELNKPSKGTIALQHDLFFFSAQEIAPALELVAGTSYKLATIPECAAFPGYGNALISEILGVTQPPGSKPSTTDSQSQSDATRPTPPQNNFGFILGVHYLLPVAILLLFINI